MDIAFLLIVRQNSIVRIVFPNGVPRFGTGHNYLCTNFIIYIIMKKTLFALAVSIFMFCSCSETSWEYKVVKVAGQESELSADFSPMVFTDQNPMLNKMGQEGWELVSTYTETSTVHPNFGNSEYVTGIRENTRTSVLNFVFKRPAKEKKE